MKCEPTISLPSGLLRASFVIDAISVTPPTLGFVSRGPKVARLSPIALERVGALDEFVQRWDLGPHPANGNAGGAWPGLPAGLFRSHPGVFKAHRLAKSDEEVGSPHRLPGLLNGATRWRDRPMLPRFGSLVPPLVVFLP